MVVAQVETVKFRYKRYSERRLLSISQLTRARVSEPRNPPHATLGGDVQIFVGDGRSGDLPIRKLSLTVTLEPGLKDTTK
jgi:hypothetical protein